MRVHSRPVVKAIAQEKRGASWMEYPVVSKAVVATLCILVLLWNGGGIGNAKAWEIDESGTVTRVIDGDTVDVSGVGRIRLADIDAPETNEPGYDAARQFLIVTVSSRVVYLDVDDVYRTDTYDRFVCVVYVRHNESSYLNVNQALLGEGLAVRSDHDNEFDPSTWVLYSMPSGSQWTDPSLLLFKGALLAVSLGIGVGVAVWALRRKPK